TRHLWYWALIATPLVLAGIAMAGYAVSAGELQARMITSGWVLLAIIIAFQIAMRGVVVAGRQAAWRQAESRRLKQREEALANAAADTGGEGAPVLPDDPDIDVVTVSQQTRGLLRAASAVLLVLLLWGTWSGLIPALGIFNDIVLWSSVTTTASGQVVGAITLGHVLLSVVLLGLTFFAARNLPGFLEVVVLHRFDIDAGTRYAYVTITRYGILAIGLLFAFSHIGADWSKLQWIIAALGVGLGFGLQEIVANFVSGIIILFERPVRVGDLITIGDTVGTVSRIKIRAITITDPDNFEVLVPNKAFITGTVKNWSLTSQITRLVIKVGVAYGSDVARAQQIMLDVAEANEQVLETPAPIVLFLGFGDSSLDLELRVFVGRIDHRLSTVNNLHLAIDKAFREAGIEIPFPQRDVHLHGLAPDESNKADPTDASESGTVTGSKYSK
ncbi:MAG: mechanosensitive ion channel, partial [Xanthomonadales bacterium]|nr:mechanosensitive ion channel [Xanthomonadales bacterium]